MEPVEYRAVIRFLVLKGNTTQRILEEMTAVYGPDAPSYSVIKYWYRHFKSGQTSVETAPIPSLSVKRSSHNHSGTGGEVQDYWEVCGIIDGNLKLSEQWILHILTLFRKEATVNYSRGPRWLAAWLITYNGTCVSILIQGLKYSTPTNMSMVIATS